MRPSRILIVVALLVACQGVVDAAQPFLRRLGRVAVRRSIIRHRLGGPVYVAPQPMMVVPSDAYGQPLAVDAYGRPIQPQYMPQPQYAPQYAPQSGYVPQQQAVPQTTVPQEGYLVPRGYVVPQDSYVIPQGAAPSGQNPGVTEPIPQTNASPQSSFYSPANDLELPAVPPSPSGDAGGAVAPAQPAPQTILPPGAARGLGTPTGQAVPVMSPQSQRLMQRRLARIEQMRQQALAEGDIEGAAQAEQMGTFVRSLHERQINPISLIGPALSGELFGGGDASAEAIDVEMPDTNLGDAAPLSAPPAGALDLGVPSDGPQLSNPPVPQSSAGGSASDDAPAWNAQ